TWLPVVEKKSCEVSDSPDCQDDARGRLRCSQDVSASRGQSRSCGRSAKNSSRNASRCRAECWQSIPATAPGPPASRRYSSVGVPQNEIHAADGRDYIRDQDAFHHFRCRLQIAEAGSPHVHAEWFGGAVAHHVIAEFAARRFDHLINLTFRDAKAFRHN